jgi:hypothetical protein
MDSDRYVANADFQSNTEQIVDLMRLCVSEVDRLQGVSNTPAVTTARDSAPEPALVPDQPPLAPPPAAGPKDPVPYTALVKTSDVSGGAFDGTVFIVLQGENGSTTEVLCGFRKEMGQSCISDHFLKIDFHKKHTYTYDAQVWVWDCAFNGMLSGVNAGFSTLRQLFLHAMYMMLKTTSFACPPYICGPDAIMYA